MIYREMSCAAIHDLSGAGKCSLTVALPVLSVCGVETSVIPTAVLSTHTGGFSGFTYRDLTEDMLAAARHWKQVGCGFSALYSGFLGSAGQIGIVGEIFGMFRRENGLVFVDPVMGDNGELYQTYTEEMAQGMGRLCESADVIAPNITEACRLLGRPYEEGPYSKAWVEEILKELCKLGPRMAVLIGVWLEEENIGAACFDAAAGRVSFFLLPRLEGFYHGTGDLFSSTLLGGLLNGMSLEGACGLATEFTHRAIEATYAHSKDYRFGPKFECALPWLGAEMERYRAGEAPRE